MPNRWLLFVVCSGALALGCKSSTTEKAEAGPTGPVGGAVQGATDAHCAGAATTIGMCTADAPDAGPPTHVFGATMYNDQGDDDACKYHLSWSASPIQENTNVIFTVKGTRLADGQPANGADVGITAFLTDGSHPTPSTQINNGELPDGVYNVGPVVFDAPGMWTVRFILYPTCSDTPPDSPQGHAAFYVSVP